MVMKVGAAIFDMEQTTPSYRTTLDLRSPVH